MGPNKLIVKHKDTWSCLIHVLKLYGNIYLLSVSILIPLVWWPLNVQALQVLHHVLHMLLTNNISKITTIVQTSVPYFQNILKFAVLFW